jgi:hypothetical protein
MALCTHLQMVYIGSLAHLRGIQVVSDQWCKFCETCVHQADDLLCPECDNETVPMEYADVDSDYETYEKENRR